MQIDSHMKFAPVSSDSRCYGMACSQTRELVGPAKHGAPCRMYPGRRASCMQTWHAAPMCAKAVVACRLLPVVLGCPMACEALHMP